MKFAEFHAGQVIEAGPYAVSEDEVLRFATAYDPQWFHTDPEAAARGPFGGLIASGWHTCGIAMRLAADAALAGSESFASPGLAYVKWPNPVRPGDALRLRATVLDVEAVAQLTAQEIERHDLSDRISAQAGDYYETELPEDMDVAMFANVLHQEQAEGVACLIARAAEALRQHGIKAVYGNAVYKRLRPGLIYVFKIGTDGHVYPETVLDM